jgi:ribosomal protein S18 acetylase RimI-like enzyme
MSSPALIRPATAADLPHVARLAAGLVRLHHTWDAKRFLIVEPVEEGYGWWLGSQLGQEGVVLLVAQVDGAIAGYLYGGLEERDWMLLRDACGMVHDVFVDAAFRRQGLARQLMRAGIDALQALGAPRVGLSTAPQNVEGQALFKSLGFRPTLVEMMRERD